MNALLAIALAGGALFVVEKRAAVRRMPHVPTVDELLGRPTTFGDSVYTDAEDSYCRTQHKIADAFLDDQGVLGVARICADNPHDFRCRAVADVDVCVDELGAEFKSSEDGIIVDAAKAGVGAVGDAVGAAVAGMFGRAAWIVVGAGVFYLVVLR